MYHEASVTLPMYTVDDFCTQWYNVCFTPWTGAFVCIHVISLASWESPPLHQNGLIYSFSGISSFINMFLDCVFISSSCKLEAGNSTLTCPRTSTSSCLCDTLSSKWLPNLHKWILKLQVYGTHLSLRITMVLLYCVDVPHTSHAPYLICNRQLQSSAQSNIVRCTE